VGAESLENRNNFGDFCSFWVVDERENQCLTLFGLWGRACNIKGQFFLKIYLAAIFLKDILANQTVTTRSKKTLDLVSQI
jgi:hypothetical protein